MSSASEKPGERCENCRYVSLWECNDDRINIGYVVREYTCHRYPPIIVDIGGRRPGGSGNASLNDFGWPQVRPYDWCGEFAPAVTSPTPGPMSNADETKE